MNYVKLDFINGDFRLIFKEDISASRHRIIRAYHLELLQLISSSGYHVWPIEAAIDLYYLPRISRYIHLLFDALNFGINPEELLPTALHEFVVCTEPVGDRPGLSQLEQLMGFTLAEEDSPAIADTSTSAENKKIATTEDEILDIKVDIFLIFKRHAPDLWQEHSLEQLAKIAKQASERMKSADEIDDSDWQDFEITPEELPQVFVDNELLIIEELKKRNIPLPLFYVESIR